MKGPIKILIINGPNLGYLGKREPEIYGRESMDSIYPLLDKWLSSYKESVTLEIFQSNIEGELIDRMERAWEEKIDGIVINAGAYTHTSLALHDCISWIRIPTIEVHLSNLWSRKEEIRHTSMLSPKCIGVISGFGIFGYVLAVMALIKHLEEKQT